MKAFVLVFILFVSAFSLKAQDTTLPQGRCQAILFSGKILKDIKLWSYDSQKLEYLKDDNLHDVLLSEVNYLKFTAGDYAFSDSLVLYKIVYDAIIFPGNETLYCFIKEIRPDKLTYCLFGEKQLHTLYRADLKKYLLKGEDDPAQYGRFSTAEPIQISQSDTNSSSLDYTSMGKEDARKEFKGNGSLAGGIICGVIPLFGWIASPVTMLVPPNTNPSKNVLFNSNKQYRNAYLSEAHKKKARKTLGGTVLGAFAVFFIALL